MSSKRNKTDVEVACEAAQAAHPIFVANGWKWSTHDPDDVDRREIPSIARITASLARMIHDVRTERRGYSATGRFHVEHDGSDGGITIGLELAHIEGSDDFEPFTDEDGNPIEENT